MCIREAHVGYIDWEEYLHNQETLDPFRSNIKLLKARQKPPRAGPTLLQSRVLCGHCGIWMRVKYGKYNGRRLSYYTCHDDIHRHYDRTCLSTRGEAIDAAVSRFLLAAVNRENLALTLAVREQVWADFAAADRQQAQRIEALHYQAALARSRYMEVDPKNRLVAASLEADWNEALTALNEATRERQERRAHYEGLLDHSMDARILELTNDFTLVWDTPATSNAERKRLLALLIEDVTLIRDDYTVRVDLRLRGGQTHTLPPVTLPKTGSDARRRGISNEARVKLEALLKAGFHDGHAAEELNRQGYRHSKGDPFFQSRVAKIRRQLNIPRCLPNRPPTRHNS